MDNRSSIEYVRNLLQEETVQRRIQENIERTRSEARVTIGRAAELFDTSEAKLREWDRIGLVRPVRSKDSATGQRQYSLAQLSKLAIIRELVDAGYNPTDIPFNVDEVWSELEPRNVNDVQEPRIPIDHRVEEAYEQEFWRYYASHILEIALSLICEDIPYTAAGLVVPLQKRSAATSVITSSTIATLGPCLICWRTVDNSFHTSLNSTPFFEYASDFQVLKLAAVSEDSTYIVLQRKVRPIALSSAKVHIVRRLIAPLYEDMKDWERYFGRGFRDILHTIDATNPAGEPDRIMNELAELIVRLGGKDTNGNLRWHFCCVLVPDDTYKPFQLCRLVMYAQSKTSPHEIGKTVILPESANLSLSLRAFQSGRIAYRAFVSSEDTVIAFRPLEEPVKSALALPVGAESDIADAVIYVVSHEIAAFTEEDRVILRLVGRLVSERLKTYHRRQQMITQLHNLIRKPEIVDPLFDTLKIASENDFIRDVEKILINVQEVGASFDTSDEFFDNTKEQTETREALSFIAIDIDNQSEVANRYGDVRAKNLIRELARRIQEQMFVLFIPTLDCRLYHIYSDRFYLMLDHVSLTQARDRAVDLKAALKGPYRVAARISNEQLVPFDTRMDLTDITVRLYVASYPYAKLYNVMQRFDKSERVPAMRDSIETYIANGLIEGQRSGGNTVISWYHRGEFPTLDKGKFRLIKWPPVLERNDE